MNNKMLHETMPIFDFATEDPLAVTFSLQAYLETHLAMGLAANQLGIRARAFIMNTEPMTVCFNPSITAYGDVSEFENEGCLSFPGLIIKIKRINIIRARFQDEKGEWQVQRLGGDSARCYQHELDHLNGITFQTRANQIHLERAKKKLKKYNRLVTT